MRTKEQNIELSEILFPDVKETRENLLERFPKRKSKGMILRFAPSPTGSIHIGNVYTGLLCSKFAKQTKGISILRIEDTDKEREIKGGVTEIVSGLRGFGIEFDEGMVDEENEVGDYGPYIQSKRLDIYRVFAKDMVAKGYAYPCFMKEEELKEIRAKQIELNVKTGCYGKWAKYKNASMQEILEMLEKGYEYVVRLNSTGDSNKSFNFKDLIKGSVTLRENDVDSVLLKSDGYPTYHFAHPIDDTLMGITHIIRADEWFSSLPLHIELFGKLDFEQLPYAHICPLMKLEDGKKRKLSKRKDPEASVAYYIKKGYPEKGIVEYLLNIANSNFYDWRIQNAEKDIDEFELKIEKFNSAGALFDVVKLNSICKNYIATLSAEEVYEKSLQWACKFDESIASLLKENEEYCVKIFNVERNGPRVRKDIIKFEDSREQLTVFFDELLMKEKFDDISKEVDRKKQGEVLKRYLEIFSMSDSQELWFEKIKDISRELSFEKVADVAMVLRVALSRKTQSPDLYQVMSVLGEDKVRERISNYMDIMV